MSSVVNFELANLAAASSVRRAPEIIVIYIHLGALA
jgi:hypothetical protein